MRGFRTLSALAAGGLVLVLAACENQPTRPADADSSGRELSALGNNFPEPGHDFNLHIIGVPQDKTADMDGNNGRRIFVRLESDNEVTNPGGKNNHLAKGGGNDQNHIYLCNSTNDEGDSTDQRCADYGNPDNWGVIDANATDGDGALLAVPDPCASNDSTDGCTPRYSVWARALAGDNATITTCADEDYAYDGTKDTWCGDNGITLYPNHGRKAQDVSDNLLYMTITVDDTYDPELAACIDHGADATDSAPDTYDVYLFDRCFQDYFWNYDNNGLKNLELRFYWET
jgi:hypothetical protein